MILIASAIALPLFLYIGFRLASALSRVSGLPRSRTRLIIFVIIGWLYVFPLALLMVRVHDTPTSIYLFSTEVSVAEYLFHFPYWIGLIVVLEALPVYLLLDIASLLSRLKPSLHIRWAKWESMLKVVLMIFLIPYCAFRSYSDTYTIRTDEVLIHIKDLPPELENLHIMLLGDLQVDKYTNGKKLEHFEELFRMLDADVIAFTGDLVTNGRAFIQQGAQALCHPTGKIANIAVMGDHDYWSDPISIPPALQECGWTFLPNQHLQITYGGRKILLTGVTNIYSNRISLNELQHFLAEAPEADLKILLAHQPGEQLVATAAENGYQLFLAGHTHGGQIVLHPLGIPVTPSRFETHYFRGRYRFHDLQVVITNGIGMSLAPLRYHAPAEITSITLRSEGSSSH